MKKQKRFITLIAVLLVLILLVPILTVLLKPLNARAVSESELYQLQQQQAQIKQQQEEIQAKLDSAQYERAAILDRKEILDRQAELTRQEIANLSTQIATYENLIAIKEDEYQAALQEKRDSLKARKSHGKIRRFHILPFCSA